MTKTTHAKISVQCGSNATTTTRHYSLRSRTAPAAGKHSGWGKAAVATATTAIHASTMTTTTTKDASLLDWRTMEPPHTPPMLPPPPSVLSGASSSRASSLAGTSPPLLDDASFFSTGRSRLHTPIPSFTTTGDTFSTTGDLTQQQQHAPGDCRSPNLLRTPPHTPVHFLDVPGAPLSAGSFVTAAELPTLAIAPPSQRLCCALAKEQSALRLVDPAYLQTTQCGRMSAEQRAEWISWLVRLTLKLKYQPETGWIACNYFDRYMSRHRVPQRRHVHLLALACLFVAAKVEEETAEPTCADLTRQAFLATSANDLKRMERKLVAGLDWHLTPVTPQCILHELLLCLPPFQPQHLHLLLLRSQHLIDKCLQKIACLRFRPSTIAVAALRLAIDLLREQAVFELGQPFEMRASSEKLVHAFAFLFSSNTYISSNAMSQNHHWTAVHSEIQACIALLQT